MDKQEIIAVLKELYKVSGFRVSLHGADYSEIAAYPESRHEFCRSLHKSKQEYEKCIECDRRACKTALAIKDTYLYKCRYGITEAVSPLYNFGTLAGFLMMGQVHEDKDTFLPSVKMAAERLYDPTLLIHFEQIPPIRTEIVRTYTKVLTICAQYLTMSMSLSNERPTLTQLVKKYVYDNYQSKISISDICQQIGCSRSTLMTTFKNETGTTVNDYITEFRLNEAVRMMSIGTMSIGEIAIKAGFSDQSYFSKVFSAKYSVSPREYIQKRIYQE